MAKNLLVINCDFRETRVALIENGIIAELHIERETQKGTLGNIYLGKVSRVLPGMQAAFIDVGLERAAFLHVEDLIRPETDFEAYLSGHRRNGEEREAHRPQANQIPAAAQSSPLLAAAGEMDELSEEDEMAAAEAEAAEQERSESRDERDLDIELPTALDVASDARLAAEDELGEVEDELTAAEAEDEGEAAETAEAAEAASDEDEGERGEEPSEDDGAEADAEPAHADEADEAEASAAAPANEDDVETEGVHASAGEAAEAEPVAPAAERSAQAESAGGEPEQGDVVEGVGVEGAEEDPTMPRTRRRRGRSRVRRSGSTLDRQKQTQAEGAAAAAGTPEGAAVVAPAPVQARREGQGRRDGRRDGGGNREASGRAPARGGSEAAAPGRQGGRQGGREAAPRDAAPREASSREAPARGDRGRRDAPGRRSGSSEGGRDQRSRSSQGGGSGGALRSSGAHGTGRHNEPPRVSKATPIRDVVREGQEVIVQISKEPIGTKGARVTSHVSLPGRYVVYLPTVDHVGVSKRIGNEKERSRLRESIESMKPPQGGIIVRTMAEGLTKKQLKGDIGYLVRLWGEIASRREETSARAPVCLYTELDLVLKTARDLFTDDIEKIVIDSATEYERLRRFVEMFMPERVDAIELYTGDEPIFDAYGIEDEIQRAQSRKVPLPAGGHLIIDQAEALTAIDVNTGRFVGKGSRDLEETILATNLEAVEEIAYQLRFRNIGGLIILDLIDMERAQNREKVRRRLDDLLVKDKAKTTLNRISDLGLIEMTRKRTRESLGRIVLEPCFYCDGTGHLQSKQTIAYEILRQMRRERSNLPGYVIIINAHPAVVDLLKSEERVAVHEAERLFQRRIELVPRKEYHLEQFDLHGR